MDGGNWEIKIDIGRTFVFREVNGGRGISGRGGLEAMARA